MNPHVNSTPPKDTSSDQNPELPPRILLPSHTTPASKHENKTNNPNTENAPRWKMVLEALVGAAIITYTIVAGWQLGTMNRTYVDIHSQTAEATKAANAAVKSSTNAEVFLEQMRELGLK